jgi:hypothetical protein
MSQITLNAAVEIVPAVPAVTTTEVTVLSIQENYGWNYDPSNPIANFGPGRPLTVEAVVLLDSERNIVRNITIWEGDAYLAVRGTWTDETLATRLTEILGG